MNILITGHFDTRKSNATSLRIRGVARALIAAGNAVKIVDVRHGAEFGGEAWTIEAAGLEAPLSGVSLDEYASGLMSQFSNGIRGLFIGDVTADYIRRNKLRPDALILYGTHLGYLMRMRKLSHNLGIPLILDAVEWYAAEDLPGGRFGPYALSNMLSMRKASLSADGYFVISEGLARHYRRTGKPVEIIPPLFSASPGIIEKWSTSDGRLHLVYAGTPGKKEAFETLIGGLNIAVAAGAEVTLHLVGVTENDVRAVPGGSAWLKRTDLASTICYGRVPNDRAKEIVARSDFSLLLRPLRRSNQYGFPSKLAESMILGTSVIANLFSDLPILLRDEENALVLPELSEGAFASKVVRAANMAAETRMVMHQNALTVARRHFDYQNYAQRMDLMLAKLRE